jgi:hypothetical protein
MNILYLLNSTNRNKKPCSTCTDSDELCVQSALVICSHPSVLFLISIVHYLIPLFLYPSLVPMSVVMSQPVSYIMYVTTDVTSYHSAMSFWSFVIPSERFSNQFSANFILYLLYFCNKLSAHVYKVK